MRALDTNVLIRFITKDEKQQAERARDLIAQGDCYIAPTVLLEAVWMLESFYEKSPEEVAAYLRTVLGVETIHVEQPFHLRLVLEWYEDGMDFADALHLATTRDMARFYTFDAGIEKVVRDARDVSSARRKLVAHLETLRL